MSGRPSSLICALLCMLPLSSVIAFGSDATGTLYPTCDFAYPYLLDLTTFRGHRLEKAIEFHVLGEYGFQLYANQWVDSRSPGDARVSRIQIVSMSSHWWRAMVMSGNFIVEFTDGKRLEGSFRAKYVKPPGDFICE
jgi:hypothetical protein